MDAAGLLEKMSFLNLNDLTDVRIGYDKRFDIRAGSLDDLTYRLRFAQTVISDRFRHRISGGCTGMHRTVCTLCRRRRRM